jgi:hypothetical protein
MTEIRVYLGVFEFGSDPQVVTDVLGIAPTKAYGPGAPKPGVVGERGGTWRHGRWELASPAGRGARVEDQLTALLPLLEERADAVAEARRRFAVQLVCVAYFREVNPGFHLDAALLRRLAELGLDFDFDMYFLGAPEEEAESGVAAG